MNSIRRCKNAYQQIVHRNDTVSSTLDEVLAAACQAPDCESRFDWPQIKKTIELFVCSEIAAESPLVAGPSPGCSQSPRGTHTPAAGCKSTTPLDASH